MSLLNWAGRSAAEEIEKIAKEVASCTRCPLHASRKNPVPGDGPADTGLMIIGEAPGASEDEQGLPFVGAAGQLLNRSLEQVGLSRSMFFVTNVVKCRPPGNRQPRPDEIKACSQFLQRQIAAIKPKVICVLGAVAARALMGRSVSITRLRGTTATKDGITYFFTYHPAAILRNPGLRRIFLADLAKLAEIVKGA